MAKVGRFVTAPNIGAYCQITLDSGEKIVVNHDTASLGAGHITIERSKLFGLSSDRLFTCDLASPEGRAALAEVTRGAEPGSAEATPLGAFVSYVQGSASAADVARRGAALLSRRAA